MKRASFRHTCPRCGELSFPSDEGPRYRWCLEHGDVLVNPMTDEELNALTRPAPATKRRKKKWSPSAIGLFLEASE
ncbi:MAG: hypothetical protein IT303_10825 [Dehalococcoidia bacterium]|nr:hypothetical protein [Dehalococcoidia bacterium]